ncbi:MAG: tetratricopeptide repeat protein [Desulfobacterales bacterium]|nr:tetratricopeptide repeat protein [Desulfobacterales bacterium]
MMMLSACAGLQPVPDRPGQTRSTAPETPVEETIAEPAPEIEDKPDDSGQGKDYRMAASHNLTRQGQELIQKKEYDRAIRVLERAVGIHPGDGRGYFYLAEAWLGKQDFNRAARFNDMAILYLRDNPAWQRRARDQKERIQELKNKQ